MRKRIQSFISRLTWAQRFMLASLFILIAGMLGIGWWVGMQIESGVVHQSASYTALYVSSIVEPKLQELASSDTITPAHVQELSALLTESALANHITAVKVWDQQGRIVYATDPANIGQVFPIDSNLTHALHGWVASDIGLLNQPENALDTDRGQRRMETYSPVRLTGSGKIIGAVEFYQTVDSLDQDIASAQRSSWLVVGATTLGMYLLLAGFVRYASDTMQRQQSELSTQVGQLRKVLKQNEELHTRVRRAARRTTALNERFLRRISAELHDGPAQDLGFALLRLDHLIPQPEPIAMTRVQEAPRPSDLQLVTSSLRHALQEIRGISAGMGLPELENLTLGETLARAVRAHERRTATRVELELHDLPDHAPITVKITAYRIIQEALSNAYRHADGINQQVCAEYLTNQLHLSISDQGPGFDESHEAEWDEHLGLVGMRERVESLGGTFLIESEVGRGTRVVVQLPLDVN